MIPIHILFVQGGGKGAHEEDAPLAASLKRALGPGYDVRYPQMPQEGDPNVKSWKQKIASELSQLSGKVVLVAHSVGGSILLRLLSEEGTETPIAGIFLLAVPSWDQDRWNYDDLKLSSNVADKLSNIRNIFFYHCRDDAIVPFEHLALHSARVPEATFRSFDEGGHQFASNLASVAADIRLSVAA